MCVFVFFSLSLLLFSNYCNLSSVRSFAKQTTLTRCMRARLILCYTSKEDHNNYSTVNTNVRTRATTRFVSFSVENSVNENLFNKRWNWLKQIKTSHCVEVTYRFGDKYDYCICLKLQQCATNHCPILFRDWKQYKTHNHTYSLILSARTNNKLTFSAHLLQLTWRFISVLFFSRVSRSVVFFFYPS